ncbi:MAG: respiratory nitrate reductase subunit gamma [Chitinophagales bacterium]
MDAFSFWVAGVMVYVAVGVFLLGMAARLIQWFSAAPSPMNLGTFPKPQGIGRVTRVVSDTLFFPQLAEVNGSLWLGSAVFHAALAGVFVGHLHLLGRFPGGLEAAMTAGSRVMGAAMGALWALSIVYLLVRRFKSPEKELSTPEDYLLLLLLLGVVVIGDHLRFFAHLPVSAYQEYVRSLYAFHPEFPPALAAAGNAKVGFVTHILFANLLLIYLPFSKLVHFVGAFFTNALRRS